MRSSSYHVPTLQGALKLGSASQTAAKVVTATPSQACDAASHLLQTCILYLNDEAGIYLDSEPHVTLVLDMLLSAVMGATFLMIEHFDQQTLEDLTQVSIRSFNPNCLQC